MDFSFSDEQSMLRDSVRKLMDRHATPDYDPPPRPRAGLSRRAL